MSCLIFCVGVSGDVPDEVRRYHAGATLSYLNRKHVCAGTCIFRLLHTLSIFEVKWVISIFFVLISPRFRLTVAVGCQYLYGPHDASGRAALGVLWVLRLGRSAKASALQRVSDENDH
jgi:hypothetical protein